MKRSTVSLLVSGAVLAVLILGCKGCPPEPERPNVNRPTPSVSPAVSPTPNKTASESTYRRVESNVLAGENDSLRPLTDDEWHDLLKQTQVNTDTNGEARLKLSGCMEVYLFQKSKMSSSPCSKSESAGTNANCLHGGTAVYNSDCATRVGQVISEPVNQTPNADITSTGTWFSVTYLPDQQLTIVVVLKGSVQVRPVLNAENRLLGEPVVVSEGHSNATILLRPGQEDFGQIANLRQPKSFAEMPESMKANLQPWLDRIAQHAKADGIAFDASVFTARQQGSPIDCDCNHVEAGLLTRQYYNECLKTQSALMDQYRKTGKVVGTCNSVAQGPNARPKG